MYEEFASGTNRAVMKFDPAANDPSGRVAVASPPVTETTTEGKLDASTQITPVGGGYPVPPLIAIENESGCTVLGSAVIWDRVITGVIFGDRVTATWLLPPLDPKSAEL
jgi:hypothetical protein